MNSDLPLCAVRGCSNKGRNRAFGKDYCSIHIQARITFDDPRYIENEKGWYCMCQACGEVLMSFQLWPPDSESPKRGISDLNARKAKHRQQHGTAWGNDQTVKYEERHAS